MDRQDTINFRRRRRRTESVEGVKRCVSKSGCCATSLVSERGVEFSPRVHPSGITRGYAWCVPSGDSGCRLGGFFFLSLSTSPRVRPSGIIRGYAWCLPAGDSEWTMSYFFSYQEKQTLGRSVLSLSFVLICRAQKYNKGVS